MTLQQLSLDAPPGRKKREFPTMTALQLDQAVRRHIGCRAKGDDASKPFIAFSEMWFPHGNWQGQRIDLWAISIWGGTKYGVKPQMRGHQPQKTAKTGGKDLDGNPVIVEYKTFEPVTLGFEFKISRSDFKHEIKHPEKRLAGMSISRAFYFVTPLGMVDVDEVPEDCGLIGVGTDLKCRKVRDAPVRDIDPCSWAFAAVIARHL
jgi:hypothetical protein